MHLAVGPLRAIGDDQSRGCDIPTSPCSQSIGNDGSFIVKSNELLAQISALEPYKRGQPFSVGILARVIETRSGFRSTPWCRVALFFQRDLGNPEL